MEKDKKRGPNYTPKEKSLLINLVYDFKSILENKKTDSTTWRQKDEAWDKITNLFNSQTTEYPRNKESLRKFYDNIKKNLRKEVAEDKREMFKTGGGSRETVRDTSKDLLLDIVNRKSLFGLDTPFGGDADEPIQEEICEENDLLIINPNAVQHPTTEHSYVMPPSTMASGATIDVTDTNKENQSETLKTSTSKELKHNLNSRRRPKIQQLSSSKLAEEYSELAKVKIDLFNTEKENLLRREEREKELFELKKRKLELDIRLTEIELSAKTSNLT